MSARFKSWRLQAAEIRSALNFPYDRAAALLTDIIRLGGTSSLAQEAQKVLPAIRSAMTKGASPFVQTTARRGFGRICDGLDGSSAPRFGQRVGGAAESPGSPAEVANRELLGLPPFGHLSEAAINEAYKRAAKRSHPDVGGNADAFSRLASARDALLKE